MEVKNKKRLFILAAVLPFMLIVIGFTAAYFVSDVGEDKRTDVVVYSDEAAILRFIKGEDLRIDAGKRNFSDGGNNLTKTLVTTAELSSLTSYTTDYYLYFNINNNDFIYTTDVNTPEIILNITGINGEVTEVEGLNYVTYDGVSGFDITTKRGEFAIAENFPISVEGDSVTTQDWTFTLTLINLDSNQNENGNKSFISEVVLQKKKLGESTLTGIAKDIYDLKNNGEESLYADTLSGYTVYGDGEIPHENYKNINNPDSFYQDEMLGFDSWEKSGVTTNETITFSYSPDKAGDYVLTFSDNASIFRAEHFANDVKIYVNDVLKDDYFLVASTTVNLGTLDTDDVVRVEYTNLSDSEETFAFVALYATAEKQTVDILPRYEGVDPNNYISFNNETWRIIGVFDTELENGKTEKLVKIIKDESLFTHRYDIQNNIWQSSDLYTILNKYYYNSDYTSDYGCSYYECDFSENGISSEYRNMVENVVWRLGGFGSIDAKQANEVSHIGTVLAEKNNYTFQNNPYEAIGHIGLIYSSDYLFAAEKDTCSRTPFGIVSNSENCARENWLHYEDFMWFITPSSVSNDQVHLQMFETNDITDKNLVVPTLYLKSNVGIIGGTGTIDDMFIIEQEG